MPTFKEDTLISLVHNVGLLKLKLTYFGAIAWRRCLCLEWEMAEEVGLWVDRKGDGWARW